MKITALNRKTVRLKNEEADLIIQILAAQQHKLEQAKQEQISRTKKPLPMTSPLWQQIQDISQAQYQLGFNKGTIDKWATRIICDAIDRTERTEENAAPLYRLLELLEEGRR
ncbi:MAG: hypothetical protein IKS78_06745 [Clostridia bacterium]|nr:hypothetical protein [Clostridia bacterium]